MGQVTKPWYSPFGMELEFKELAKTKQQGGALVALMSKYVRKFKDEKFFMLWIFHKPMVVFTKPEDVEFVLSSNTFLDKAIFYELLHPWLGTGLLTSTGTKWRSRRKLITPAFHFRILDDFLKVFNEQSIIFTEKIEEKNGEEFDVVKMVQMCTLDIICETAMGVNVNAQTNSESKYVKAVSLVGEKFIERVTSFWTWSNNLYKMTPTGRQYFGYIEVLHDFTRKVIKERRLELEAKRANSDKSEEVEEVAGKKLREPFLNLLFKRHFDHGDLSLDDIQEEVDTFMFEGHDTTAMGISWLLYLLAENTEAQQKCYEELEKIFGNDRERHATLEDLSEMKYLDCCLKEAQRLYPSVPLIGRTLQEGIHYKKSWIPKGSLLTIPIYQFHRNESVFPDPEAFQPERFLPENSVNRHPYAYVPFSAGPRNCIGQKFAVMEEKTVVSWILRRAKLSTTMRRSEILVLAELVTRPAQGLMVTATPRS